MGLCKERRNLGYKLKVDPTEFSQSVNVGFKKKRSQVDVEILAGATVMGNKHENIIEEIIRLTLISP